jgi:hypothetical protein
MTGFSTTVSAVCPQEHLHGIFQIIDWLGYPPKLGAEWLLSGDDKFPNCMSQHDP